MNVTGTSPIIGNTVEPSSFDPNKLIAPFLASENKAVRPSIGTLPNDVIKELILKHLSQGDRIAFRSVCKRFKAICPNQLSTKERRDILLAAMRDAAALGSYSLLHWHQDTLRCPWHPSISASAARSGKLDMLKWLRENGCPWSEFTWEVAHESVKPWLRENACPGAN